MNYNLKICLLFSALLTLNACNHHKVEKHFDEFKQNEVCSLKNYLLTAQFGFFKEYYKVKLNLDKQDHSDIIQGRIYIHTSSPQKIFSKSPCILLKFLKSNGKQHEIRLRGSSVYNARGNVIDYTQFLHSSVSINFTKKQIEEIANSESVSFAIETLDDPIKGELTKDELLPIKEFLQNCLEPSQTRLSYPNA